MARWLPRPARGPLKAVRVLFGPGSVAAPILSVRHDQPAALELFDGAPAGVGVLARSEHGIGAADFTFHPVSSPRIPTLLVQVDKAGVTAASMDAAWNDLSDWASKVAALTSVDLAIVGTAPSWQQLVSLLDALATAGVQNVDVGPWDPEPVPVNWGAGGVSLSERSVGMSLSEMRESGRRAEADAKARVHLSNEAARGFILSGPIAFCGYQAPARASISLSTDAAGKIVDATATADNLSFARCVLGLGLGRVSGRVPRSTSISFDVEVREPDLTVTP